MSERFDAEAILARAAAAGDADIDIAEAALALSALDAPDLDPAPLRAHLRLLARSAASVLGGASAADAPPERVAAALSASLHGAFGYEGDADDYDSLKNADLAQVIARRRGLPVALGILYIATARAIGAPAHGVNFPGHFLVRAGAGEGVLIDPFGGGHLVEIERLERALPEGRRLEPEHLAGMSDAAVLLRLLNNVKGRTRGRDPVLHRRTIERMLTLAPDAGRLWYERGEAEEEASWPGAAAKSYAGRWSSAPNPIGPARRGPRCCACAAA